MLRRRQGACHRGVRDLQSGPRASFRGGGVTTDWIRFSNPCRGTRFEQRGERTVGDSGRDLAGLNASARRPAFRSRLLRVANKSVNCNRADFHKGLCQHPDRFKSVHRLRQGDEFRLHFCVEPLRVHCGRYRVRVRQWSPERQVLLMCVGPPTSPPRASRNSCV